jgi:hypothetical protein
VPEYVPHVFVDGGSEALGGAQGESGVVVASGDVPYMGIHRDRLNEREGETREEKEGRKKEEEDARINKSTNTNKHIYDHERNRQRN